MTVTIASIVGESINDSRNVPTLNVTVTGSNGKTGSFAVPSGASTGIHEAYELRDDGTSHGGVSKAINGIKEEINEALVGVSVFDQKMIDEKLIALDGTNEKKRLGGNTLIGVSIAVAKLAAASLEKEVWEYLHDEYFKERTVGFPRLYANLINGGKHATTKLAFQEYHVVPKTSSVTEALALISLIQEKLYKVSLERFFAVSVGDEGGYALPLSDIEEPLTLLTEVTESLMVRDQVDFALDVASSSFFDQDRSQYLINDQLYTKEEMLSLYQGLIKKYHLLSIEDPFNEEDFNSFRELGNENPSLVRVGDDLTTTSVVRLRKAKESESVDALIIKPNQIGTLTEVVQTMQYAHENNISCIVSHRSGETLDDFIADLAYASGAFGIKAGARGPQEREAKYKRLVAIKESQN